MYPLVKHTLIKRLFLSVSVIELLSGSGHMMVYDNPDGLAKVITCLMKAM
ncbi:hypothetical protein D083_3622 [Dickeya solani RNS 08.23.3.1.A]|nr:hypothetical protein D083_3622 [Dickeya solani RNS 08.23.3.1.A]